MRPKVHTEKHIVQDSFFTIASGAIRSNIFVIAKQDPAAAQPTQVREGATISACYVELWLTSDDAAQGTVVVTLERRDGPVGVMSAGDSAALNVYDNKKNILHTMMGVISPNVQMATPVLRGWYKIPKGKQRFGLEDKLVLNVLAQSNGVNGCGVFIYKEQY